MTNPSIPGVETMSSDNKEFLRGFAIALADMNRMHDAPVHVRDTIEGAGLTMADFKRAGVEEYDLKELRKAFA